MTPEEIRNRLAAITCELSDIYERNKHATVDMGGNQRTSLTAEWVMLSNMLEAK